MNKVSIKLNSGDIAKLEKELERLNSIRFDAVLKKNLKQILNTARSDGTPIDSQELRKSSSMEGGEVGYTKEYAPHVEYGHRTRNGGFVQGQHFLKNNVDAQMPIYYKDLKEAIQKG